MCGVLGHLAPDHRCACSVFCFVCAVSWASWLLFTGVPARFVVLCLRCPGPLGSCSPVCPLGVLCCVCGVLGPLAPVHRCARWVCCVACAVSWATWLLLTGAPARCVALRARCPGPLGSCSPVCLLCLLFCLCGFLGHLAPVHRCARLVCCFVCAVSWASWLLFTGVPGRGVPSLCCPRCTRVCGVLALVAPVHRCARCVRCACAIGGCVPLPPPLILVFFSVFFFEMEKKKKQGRAYTAGTGTGSWCSGAIVLCPLACAVGALAAVAPQVCSSRVLVWVRVGLVRCLFASGAGWLGGCVGCGCGLWQHCSLGGPGRSQGLAVLGCGSGLICVGALARLGGCDGCGPGFGAFGRSGVRCCVRWRPSASGSLGDFWAGPGVAPRGGGLLGNGVSRRRRWLGGQASRAVWRAGLLGCCGCRRCRCADTCGVVRGCVCAGLGFG